MSDHVTCAGCRWEMLALTAEIAEELHNATPAYCEQWHPLSEI